MRVFRASDPFMVLRGLLALTIGVFASSCATAYDAEPKRPTSLAGRWIINAAQSDDPEKMLDERLERERERMRRELERWRRAERAGRALPPLADEDADVPAATKDARARVMRWREREMQLYRRMLAISPTLRIEQEGRRIDIASTVESRRFNAGAESQISMPEGQLADLRTGWDGEWFVVQRVVRNGPRVIEQFRLLEKTDQLEYRMAWSGDTDLRGMKVRRIYDRDTREPTVRNPDLGPVR